MTKQSAARLKPIAIYWVMIAVGLFLTASGLISLSVGNKFISPDVVLETLFGQTTPLNHAIIFELRLPRAISACFVGMALGIAGALLQGITLNPIASPSLIGINSGAACALVLLQTTFNTTSAIAKQSAAFMGALLTVCCVYWLAYNKAGAKTPVRLAIAGAALSLFLSAITTAVLLFNERAVEEIRFWLAGSIWGTDWNALKVTIPTLITASILALALSPTLKILSLGNTTARSLGMQTTLVQISLGGLALLLAGGATTLAGPIGFVGLLTPHIARAIVGYDYTKIIPTSAVLGALLVLVSDTLGRWLFSPIEIPVSAITALIGIGYFLIIVRRLSGVRK